LRGSSGRCSLKRNYDGCAICNSTWGDVWADVAGERVFFCCDLCAVQYRGLLERILRESGWSQLDSIEISGDRRGRTAAVTGDGSSARFTFSFDSEGKLLRFHRQDGAVTSPTDPPSS
jgi:hypothetical protein